MQGVSYMGMVCGQVELELFLAERNKGSLCVPQMPNIAENPTRMLNP
jgi:hypothetical protein